MKMKAVLVSFVLYGAGCALAPRSIWLGIAFFAAAALATAYAFSSKKVGKSGAARRAR